MRLRNLIAPLFSSFAVAISDDSVVRADTTFIGPEPYASVADSPFNVSNLGRTIFLEDFEDGELNTPGVRQATIEDDGPYLVYAFRGEVVGPGPMTDSVDGDAGPIDGSGAGGSSLMTSNCFKAQATGNSPIYHLCQFNLVFEASQLGYLPNAVGFVWTDGPPDARFEVTVRGAGGADLGAQEYFGLGDTRADGTTAEDRFFGVMSSEGIALLELASIHTGEPHALEIDHLQYGLAIPEPSAAILLLLATLGTAVPFPCLYANLGPFARSVVPFFRVE